MGAHPCIIGAKVAPPLQSPRPPRLFHHRSTPLRPPPPPRTRAPPGTPGLGNRGPARVTREGGAGRGDASRAGGRAAGCEGVARDGRERVRGQGSGKTAVVRELAWLLGYEGGRRCTVVHLYKVTSPP